MPTTVAGTLEAVVARLRSAGYAATADPGELNPPGIWVSPRTVTDRTLAGGGSLVVWLYLIAPGVDPAEALTLLDDLLAGLDDLGLAADPTDPDVDLTTSVVLPTGSNPLPAFRLAVTIDLLEIA